MVTSAQRGFVRRTSTTLFFVQEICIAIQVRLYAYHPRNKTSLIRGTHAFEQTTINAPKLTTPEAQREMVREGRYTATRNTQCVSKITVTSSAEKVAFTVLENLFVTLTRGVLFGNTSEHAQSPFC